MSKEIKNVQLQFSCSANWNAMEQKDGGRFCNQCQKTVYDFTSSKAAEFERILAENNYNLCGRFTRQQATTPVVLPFWRKWVSAAMVLIGFNVLGNKAVAQSAKSAAPLTTTSNQPAQSNEIFGGISEYPPEFPGGIDKFYKFIDQNINPKKTYIPGRVIVTFVVETDGSLLEVKALRGSSKDNEQEAIRVVKLSPKWRPGLQSGKPARVQYTVPVTFK